MNRPTLILASVLATLGLFVGGFLLGNLMRGGESEAVAADGATVEIPVAIPLASGDDLPDPAEVDERLSASPSVKFPADLVEPGPTDPDDPTPPGPGAFNIVREDPALAAYPAGADPDDGPRPPYEPLTVPLGETDDEGDGDRDGDPGYEVLGERDEVDLVELLGPGPDDPGPFPFGPGPGDDGDGGEGDDTEFFHFGFLDWCAGFGTGDEDSDDDGDGDGDGGAPGFCPFGIGGTILPIDGGTDHPPFQIIAVYGEDTPHTDACHPLGYRDGDESTLHVLMTANAPGEFEISYWRQGDHDGTVLDAVAVTDDERTDRWIERRAGGLAAGRTYMCVPLAIPETWSAGWLTLDISATDVGGRTTDARFGMALPGRAADPVARPDVRLDTSVSDRRGRTEAFFSVPFDPEVEQAWIAVIPLDGPRSTGESCTDIERAVLDGERSVDRVVDSDYVARIQQRQPHWDPRFSHAAVARVTPEPGTTYEFCGWTTVPGTRSVDPSEVNSRGRITATSPQTLSARIYLTGGILTTPLDRGEVTFHASNWHISGRELPFTITRLPAEDTPPGEFALDEPLLLLDSITHDIPNETVLQLKTDSGWVRAVILPTDVRCDWVCPDPSLNEYAVPVPGPTPGWLRILVETEAGPAGHLTHPGFARWTVPVLSTFDAPDSLGPWETPRLDQRMSTWEARGSGVEPRSLHGDLVFDRPVRIVEAVPTLYQAVGCGRDPGVENRAEFSDRIELSWDDVCLKRNYTLSLLVEDEDGNRLDLRTARAGGDPERQRGFGLARTDGVHVTTYEWEVQVHRLADHVGVHQSWFGNAPMRSAGGGHFGWCADPEDPWTFSGSTGRPHGGTYEWDEEVEFDVEAIGSADVESCGADDPTPHREVFGTVSVFDLVGGSPVVLDLVDDDLEVTVTITDVVLAD